jgi:hypothetical protein
MRSTPPPTAGIALSVSSSWASALLRAATISRASCASVARTASVAWSAAIAACSAMRPGHDRCLFADVSRLIYSAIYQFYAEAAGRPLLTGMVIEHQTFGDVRVVPQRSEERSRQCSAGTPTSTPDALPSSDSSELRPGPSSWRAGLMMKVRSFSSCSRGCNPWSRSSAIGLSSYWWTANS